MLPSNPPPSLPVHPPTSEEIDAVIQQATSAVSSDGRHVPLKDTRTQLFVGNVCFLLSSPYCFRPCLFPNIRVFVRCGLASPSPLFSLQCLFVVSTGAGVGPLSRFNFHVSHSSPNWDFAETDLRHRHSFPTGFAGRTSKTSSVRPALYYAQTSPWARTTAHAVMAPSFLLLQRMPGVPLICSTVTPGSLAFLKFA